MDQNLNEKRKKSSNKTPWEGKEILYLVVNFFWLDCVQRQRPVSLSVIALQTTDKHTRHLTSCTKQLHRLTWESLKPGEDGNYFSTLPRNKCCRDFNPDKIHALLHLVVNLSGVWCNRRETFQQKGNEESRNKDVWCVFFLCDCFLKAWRRPLWGITSGVSPSPTVSVVGPACHRATVAWWHTETQGLQTPHSFSKMSLNQQPAVSVWGKNLAVDQACFARCSSIWALLQRAAVEQRALIQ